MAAGKSRGDKMSQDYHRDRQETQDQTVIGWTPGEDKTSAEKRRELVLRVLVYGLGALFVCVLLSIAVAAWFYF
jgi:hypothetical protein